MTSHWVDLFRILTRHRTGYVSQVNARIVAEFNDTITRQIAQRLYMVAPPEGDAMGISTEAREWLAEGAA